MVARHATPALTNHNWYRGRNSATERARILVCALSFFPCCFCLIHLSQAISDTKRHKKSEEKLGLNLFHSCIFVSVITEFTENRDFVWNLLLWEILPFFSKNPHKTFCKKLRSAFTRKIFGVYNGTQEREPEWKWCKPELKTSSVFPSPSPSTSTRSDVELKFSLSFLRLSFFSLDCTTGGPGRCLREQSHESTPPQRTFHVWIQTPRLHVTD